MRARAVKRSIQLYAYVIAALVLFVLIVLIGAIFRVNLVGGTINGALPLFLFLVIVGVALRTLAHFISSSME